MSTKLNIKNQTDKLLKSVLSTRVSESKYDLNKVIDLVNEGRKRDGRSLITVGNFFRKRSVGLAIKIIESTYYDNDDVIVTDTSKGRSKVIGRLNCYKSRPGPGPTLIDSHMLWYLLGEDVTLKENMNNIIDHICKG